MGDKQREPDLLWTGQALKFVELIRTEIVSFRDRVAEQIERAEIPRNKSSLTSQSILAKLGANPDVLVELVERLDSILKQNGFEGKTAPLTDGRSWSLGTYDLRFDHCAIHNGFLEPILRLPIVEHLTERVVTYFITIEGDDDLLVRERGGGIGWHYHYLNRWEQRSDVLLAWDTRAKATQEDRGIFSEKHAERGKAFCARPAGWKDAKRRSIHTVCRRDLEKWGMSEFRNASNDANAVWPRHAVVTPRPLAKQTVANNAKSVSSRSRRR